MYLDLVDQVASKDKHTLPLDSMRLRKALNAMLRDLV